MSTEIEKCYLIETGYSFSTPLIKKGFHRGDYIPYWELPIFCKSRNGYSAFNSAYRYSNTEIDSADVPTLLYGNLYLDFDSEEDFEAVRKDALVTASYFKIVFKIPEEYIELYYSGKKGIHMIIPSEILGIEPNTQLNLIFKYIASAIKSYTPNKTIDLIYDSKRLFRIPNTIHEATGLYKIPITFDELRNLNKEQLQDLAKQPRKLNRTKILEINKTANTQYKRMSEEFVKFFAESNKDFSGKKTINFVPQCIQNILDNGAPVGQRNNTIAILASFLKQFGKSYKEACNIITEWNSKNSSPTGDNELKRTVKSLYSTDKTYGCNSILLYTECDCSNCKIHMRKENKDGNKNSQNQSSCSYPNKRK
jgi:hypothetical protein